MDNAMVGWIVAMRMSILQSEISIVEAVRALMQVLQENLSVHFPLPTADNDQEDRDQFDHDL